MAGGHHGRWGRVTVGKLREEGARRLIAINASKRWKGAREKRSRRDRSCGGARPGGAGEGKGKKKETPTGGARVSATHKKKKKRREGGPLRGKVKRAAGLLGRKSEREVRFSFFSFFPF
jgi:hypothetical protein